jgi:hypothetical protein
MTRFIEGALAARLLQPAECPGSPLPAYHSGAVVPDGFDLVAAMAEADAATDAALATRILPNNPRP